MTRRHCLPIAALLLLGACEGRPFPDPVEQVQLPAAANASQVTDPTRGAILSAAYVFGQPETVAGNPAAAAEALGQLEYLTAELASNSRWQDLDALVVPMLRQGRAEARTAFGFRSDAPAQLAVEALYGAAAALRSGDRARAEAALRPLTGPGREAGTIERLAALPRLPQAAAATARAQNALTQRDRNQGRALRF